MHLRTLSFSEFGGEPGEWRLDEFALGPINLIVAKNATGKTRLLNVVNWLAGFLCGTEELRLGPVAYHVRFEDDTDGSGWEYRLEARSAEIELESLIHNEHEVLHRGGGGMGTIDAEDVNGTRVRMRFKAPNRVSAVVAKRDEIQHPFLEPLHAWGNSARHFQFGYEMRPHNLALLVEGVKIEVDEKSTSSLVPIYNLAHKTFGAAFDSIVMDDMRRLGYQISGFKIRRPEHVILATPVSADVRGLAVQEESLRVMTDQPSMSQGMFRSLSLLIQTTYYMMSMKSGCILIDDVGEGLDFERSAILIDLLREKAQSSRFQLLMSTNNRFVMNRVPLEEWCVLQRNGGLVRMLNYANSRDKFEEFKITGLSNFDLLATDYLGGVR